MEETFDLEFQGLAGDLMGFVLTVADWDRMVEALLEDAGDEDSDDEENAE